MFLFYHHALICGFISTHSLKLKNCRQSTISTMEAAACFRRQKLQYYLLWINMQVFSLIEHHRCGPRTGLDDRGAVADLSVIMTTNQGGPH
jgi:hypothetical protein